MTEKDSSTPLFQPGLHQKLTQACRDASASPNDQYAVKGELLSNIVFSNAATEPIVTFNHDGTITVAKPEKIDETAQAFLAAVQDLLKNGWVVRKKGVSEFLSFQVGEEYWVQDLDSATHFARARDAELAFSGGDIEVIPASQAMLF